MHSSIILHHKYTFIIVIFNFGHVFFSQTKIRWTCVLDDNTIDVCLSYYYALNFS